MKINQKHQEKIHSVLDKINCFMFLLLFVAGSAVDSDSWIPFIFVIVSTGWLAIFARN